jgi:hypothetical protein
LGPGQATHRRRESANAAQMTAAGIDTQFFQFNKTPRYFFTEKKQSNKAKKEIFF